MEFYCCGTKIQYLGGKRHVCVLFAGCNFRCPYCYNSPALDFRQDCLTDMKQVKRHILSADAEGVVFGGGEPTLQQQAALILARYCKVLGKKTILLTNGSKPDTLKLLLRENLFDRIVLDIKSPFSGGFEKRTKSRTYFRETGEIMDDVRRSLSFLRDARRKVTVKTVVAPPLLYRKEDILGIAEAVQDFTWVLSGFVPGDTAEKRYRGLNTPSPGFMSRLKEICGRAYPGSEILVE